MSFAKRLKEYRLKKDFSKSELATKIGVHYSQIGRYEEKGAMPSADIITKIANILEVSVDFLMNGNKEDLANNSITDKELLNQFKIIEQFEEKDKNIIKSLLDAFITKKKIQKLAV